MYKSGEGGRHCYSFIFCVCIFKAESVVVQCAVSHTVRDIETLKGQFNQISKTGPVNISAYVTSSVRFYENIYFSDYMSAFIQDVLVLNSM